MKCEIIRNHIGVLCGYVYITKLLKEHKMNLTDIDISCHGGLTYSEYRHKYLVIGFDCGHHTDIIPSLKSYNSTENIFIFRSNDDVTYKTMKYVEYQLISIVEQLDINNDNILTKIQNREKNISNLLDK